jgi:transposase
MVKPFLKGHKNDYRDAEAIAEAVQRPTMHFVTIKTLEQMDLLVLHRVRSRLVGRWTGVINQIRGFLIERGITVRQGPTPLRKALSDLIAFPEAQEYANNGHRNGVVRSICAAKS